MEEAILNSHKQFGYEPEIKNTENYKPAKNVILAGMGGSHLAGGIIKDVLPEARILLHWDYGLPSVPEDELGNSLLIASSYSGNTEETVSFAEAALERGLNLLCVSTGGRLIELAKERGLPYIELPDDGIQPRSALGYSMIATAKAAGMEELIQELASLQEKIDPSELRGEGEELAGALAGFVPVIYTSRAYSSLAYNWKIKMNETGKIPAFYNIFPELNHNEMQGFDPQDSNRALSERFHFVFLEGLDEDARVAKRMEVTKKLYEDRGLGVLHKRLEGETKLERIFRALVIGDWTAYTIAAQNGAEPEAVPMVEEFKRLI